MDKKRIIQQGEVAKFQVQIQDFDMEANDFRVELIYGMRQKVVTINKSQMLENGGQYFIIFDTSKMVARVTARCVWLVPDTDVEGGLREKTDEQYLCFVVATPCPQFICCPDCSAEHPVTYTRTDQSDIADKYQRLADKYDRPLVTADGETLFVLKPQND